MAETKVEQKPKATIPGFKPDGKLQSHNGDSPEQAESKADKWKRLVNSRGYKAVKAIGALSTLANRHQYEYTDEQVAKLLTALNTQVATVKAAFESRVKANAPAAIV